MLAFLLLPMPHEISFTGGTLDLSKFAGIIALKHNRAASLLFSAQKAQTALKQYTHSEWKIAGGDLLAPLIITVDANAAKPEGYRLSIGAQGIQVIGGDLAGAFYGVCTFVQLVQAHGSILPLLEITDWPDFPARGVMLDISRDKVPTMEQFYALVDKLAGWKINQIQLYTEHTFAYRKHRIIWENASPITAEQILALDAYCRERYIDLVPNQNSIGHMHRWFKHKRYLPLAETEGGLTTPWGTKQDYAFSLSPVVPEVFPFLEALYDELLPNFTSQMFNIGGDETFDLGEGRSKPMMERKGKGGVYLDFLLEIYQRVKERGRTMQFWGDIINQYPDLVPEVPKDTIALEWGYEATHDFPGKSALFAESGIPFYVCPGTSSWASIAGRTDNAISNIRNAVENGLKNSAIGVLNTDWGDYGHWQPLPVSYLGFAYGAALSWGYSQNVDIDLPAVLSAFAFQDTAAIMGQLAYDLGNAYQKPEVVVHNGSILFWAYNMPLEGFPQNRPPDWVHGNGREIMQNHRQFAANLHQTIDYVDQVMAKLANAQMTTSDADIIKHEFSTAARMLKHGAKRALLQLNDSVNKQALLNDFEAIEVEYQQNWLARNRPGGLADSVARLRRAREMYMA
jgi:hexosaminidase